MSWSILNKYYTISWITLGHSYLFTIQPRGGGRTRTPANLRIYRNLFKLMQHCWIWVRHLSWRALGINSRPQRIPHCSRVSNDNVPKVFLHLDTRSLALVSTTIGICIPELYRLSFLPTGRSCRQR